MKIILNKLTLCYRGFF